MTDSASNTEQSNEFYALTAVKLTDAELLLLDGQCSEDVQATIDLTKRRRVEQEAHPDLPPKLARFIADVVAEATAKGQLVFQRIDRPPLRHCSLCGRAGGHAKYKSGPRRGMVNYDRPLHFTGFELAKRFVGVQGYANLGGCADCITTVKPLLIEALREVPTQLPNALYGGGTRWTRHDKVHCTKCGWDGHEGQLGKLRTLMGDGWYPGICPSCGAEHRPLTTGPFERPDGFELVAHSTHGTTP